jgi:hypothetical protein
MSTRGRKPTTGPFATREELCEKVRWYYRSTGLSMEAIGKRFGISQMTVRKILHEAPPDEPPGTRELCSLCGVRKLGCTRIACPWLFDVVQTRDGYFRHVSHALQLATPGWGSPQAADRNANGYRTDAAAVALMAERYRDLFVPAQSRLMFTAPAGQWVRLCRRAVKPLAVESFYWHCTARAAEGR